MTLTDHAFDDYSPPMVAWIGTWKAAVAACREGVPHRRIELPHGGEADAITVVDAFNLDRFVAA